jgi:hypothetical protein
MFAPDRHIKALRKRAKRGFAGYPIATFAFYGPTDRLATKLAVGIVLRDEGEAEHMQRWYSEDRDIRLDHQVMEQALAFVRSHAAKSVVMAEGILRCPHEEGIDYPEGEDCPQCPFWAGR